jgi:hypothetical protein
MVMQGKGLAILGGNAPGITAFGAVVKRFMSGSTGEDPLCNSLVEIASMASDNPHDSFDFLQAQGRNIAPDTFARRACAGEIFSDCFLEYSAITGRDGINVIHLLHRFLPLRATSDGTHLSSLLDAIKPRSITVIPVTCRTLSVAALPAKRVTASLARSGRDVHSGAGHA